MISYMVLMDLIVSADIVFAKQVYSVSKLASIRLATFWFSDRFPKVGKNFTLSW